MADFNIRSDSVDVEQIMTQIRSRLRDKRGVDYTEEQVRELASVRLEKFLDPKNLRSDLLEQFRRSRPALPEPPAEPPPVEAPFTVDEQMLFRSHRAPLRWLRALLKPILKLFFNPVPLIKTLSLQADFNLDLLKRDVRRRVELQQQVAAFERSRGEWNVLYYEVLHNLVLETTRNGIELKNLKMRVEALASRLDFSERRVRALEGVVQYRPEVIKPREPERERGREREGERERNRGRDRDRDRSNDRDGERSPLPQYEGPTISLETEPTESSSSPDPEVVSAGVAPATGESPGRKRRRRRRGRRGATAPGGVVNNEAGSSQETGGDDDFEEVDESDAAVADAIGAPPADRLDVAENRQTPVQRPDDPEERVDDK